MKVARSEGGVSYPSQEVVTASHAIGAPAFYTVSALIEKTFIKAHGAQEWLVSSQRDALTRGATL